ncbi:MAG: CotH kinase family protein [Lachnospiraceae bacterium]|nr:CotH kinase family protein [Lachnospiraceae bacterium]
MLSGKERRDFEPSDLRFEEQSIPYDSVNNTAYLPQSVEDPDWSGSLSTVVQGGQICILNDSADDKRALIEEGRTCRLAVVSDQEYRECDLVFTGLPVVCMSNQEGVIEGEDEYRGNFLVFDPYREQYQESDCTFHVRGATSLLFDKKSYRVELQQTRGSSDKKSFLGMRSDDDWILNSLCTDQSLSREKVCYKLWRDLNAMEERPVASSEIEYCELLVNGEYMGIYGLMYPVDRKLMDMNPGDLLYKVGTWYEEISIEGQLVDYNGQTAVLNRNGVPYLTLKYPKEEGSACIYDPFQLYQEMVFETGDLSKMEEEGISLNLDNFILHELFCEMTRAGDNTWKNLFLAAYRNNEGGYTLNETIWDLNYTFGDDFTWDPDHGNTVFDPGTTDSYEIRYDRDYGYASLVHIVDGLREDTGVKWRKWRSQGIGPESVREMFEENRSYLEKSGAFKRNSLKWYEGSQEPSYAQVYEWIDGRFRFLDKMYEYDNYSAPRKKD